MNTISSLSRSLCSFYCRRYPINCRVNHYQLLHSSIPATGRRSRRKMAISESLAMINGTEGKTVPLLLYNSLSKKKEEFIPMNGKRVLWYSCGPTVYDCSHMGHARSYITFDIIRRVLVDYFGYDVFFVMNITDIDDKIINRARQKHLFEQYSNNKERSMEEVLKDCKEAIELFEEKIAKETDKDKLKMLKETLSKAKLAIYNSAKKDAVQMEVIEGVRDPLSKWLDKKYGSSVTDHKIFSALSRHWEEDYHRDMEDLNVLPAHVLTRVTEYVPEVIRFIEKIIENGFGYESNGSVYFDTVKFSSSPDHHYAKLVPEAIGDLKALQEGEGELSVSTDRLQEKRHNNDFALWKASKQGEPAWPSPWGPGRPGWHIECSVMACEILGSTADIHTGGVDLKFPHHDNEIAQVEAHYQSDHWVNFFLHAGHLTIEGCKMAKSLKNFITIKDALKKYTAAQLRLSFLLHSWNATLDYSENNMQEALLFEKTLNEFFLGVKDRLRVYPTGVERFQKWGEAEKELNEKFRERRSLIHLALCDSIDTPSVVRLIREIVSLGNGYMNDITLTMPNAKLLETIAEYITYLMKVFGVINTTQSIGFPQQTNEQAINTEEVVMPYVTALSDFREKVRDVAREENVPRVLSLCDWVRDELMVDLGVRLEDKTDRTVVKVIGKEAILKEKEWEKQQAEKKRLEKEEIKRRMEEQQRQKEAQARIRPQDLFTSLTEQYSQFDENGIPTHDSEGNPLKEKKIKKLQKLWQAQEKKYNDFAAKRGIKQDGASNNVE